MKSTGRSLAFLAAFGLVMASCDQPPTEPVGLPEHEDLTPAPNITPELSIETPVEAPGAPLPRFSTVASPGNVLIYGPSMSPPTGFRPQNEQTLAAAAGHTVTVASAVTWASMSTAQFAAYDAIVFGDATCQTGTASLATADANKAVWSAAITGPMYVQGSDPQYHQFLGAPRGPQALQMITSGINFAASLPGSTGLYVSLSCYYYNVAPGTPVNFLSALGSFVVRGQFTGGNINNVVIVDPGHSAMAGLTSAGLSNWGNSIHEFLTTFPASFHVLATNNTADVYIIATADVIFIDIKPGSFPNSINPKSMGVVPVAILGSEDFDVTDVDVTTLTFGPAGATPAHDLTDPLTYADHLQDVNLDGYMDLVSHYRQKETGLAPGDTEACIEGATNGGTPIEGCDSVNVLDPGP